MRVPKMGLLALVALSVPSLTACFADEPPVDIAPTAVDAARQLTDVIPAPAQVVPAAGAAFRLTASTGVRTAAGSLPARQVGELLAGFLRPATGFPLFVRDATADDAGAVSLLLDGADSVGDEGYQLDITTTGVTLRARTAAGLFHGAQTLRQLLPPAIEAGAVQPGQEWVLPGGRIVDTPRFAYRGAMLDLARHFFTPDEIKTFIDRIAQFKVNHLHLHLTDDQGWRVEIEGWPQLTAVGGGAGTGVDGAGPGFLTRAQYADVVAYAATRFITVVPEIDMPGHTNAAQTAYVELNCDGVAVKPRTDSAVGYSSLCIDADNTYAFVEDVIRELAAMTPGPYLHIGGDEALATTDEDYRTFMTRVLPMVTRYGKRAIGWHEVANVRPEASVVPQYWGIEPTADPVTAAAAAGNKILMSPADVTYLDMKYDADTALGQDWAGLISVEKSYDWDPATRLPGVGEEHILGVESPLWTETIRSVDDVETMVFPRLPATMEIGWSPAATHDWQSLRRRIAAFGPRWSHQGVNFHRASEIDWP